MKKPEFNLDLDYDFEGTTINVYGSAYWGADNESDYKRQEKLIDDYRKQLSCGDLHVWCDISGYNYWMVQQEEANYISITVNLNVDDLTADQITEIENAIIEADGFMTENLNSYLPFNNN